MAIDQDTRQLMKIIISAREPSGTEQRPLAAGALAFVPKPLDNEKLIDAIRSALREE